MAIADQRKRVSGRRGMRGDERIETVAERDKIEI
jgi:hypothetical protein